MDVMKACGCGLLKIYQASGPSHQKQSMWPSSTEQEKSFSFLIVLMVIVGVAVFKISRWSVL